MPCIRCAFQEDCYMDEDNCKGFEPDSSTDAFPVPIMTCPRCGRESEDFDGLGVLYCESCGYCVHASVTNGVCDYCGGAV
jgi:hypothetical protein